jgi:hypothetical protein
MKKSLKIPKGQSESVYRKRTDNTMAHGIVYKANEWVHIIRNSKKSFRYLRVIIGTLFYVK